MISDMKTPYAGAEGMFPQIKGKYGTNSQRVCRILWSKVFFYRRSLSVGKDVRLTSKCQ